MPTLDERMTAFEKLSLASKLDLLAREVFSQKYGNVFTSPCKWDFNNIQNFGGFPQPGFGQPVKVEKGEWVENRGGGKCPVEKDTWVEVEYRDGVKQVCQAMVADNAFGDMITQLTPVCWVHDPDSLEKLRTGFYMYTAIGVDSPQCWYPTCETPAPAPRVPLYSYEAVKKLEQRRDELLAALTEIANWVDKYTSAGHPVSTIARKAIAKGEVDNENHN